MDLIFGNDDTSKKNTQETIIPEFKEDNEEDLRSSDEWNMVDESKKEEDRKQGTYFDLLSNASTQNIIVEILNNKLHDLTGKIDLILNKLNTLEDKIDKLEENQQKNDSLFKFSNDNLALNNIDLKNILNPETDPENSNSKYSVNETTQIYHNSLLNYNQPPIGLNMLPNIGMNNLNNLERRFPLSKK